MPTQVKFGYAKGKKGVAAILTAPWHTSLTIETLTNRLLPFNWEPISQ